MSDSDRQSSGRPGQVCPAAHSGWLTLSVRRLFNNPHRILRGLVGESGTAVDLGCGPGFFTLPLARIVGPTGRVVAVDIQEEMLSRLRARAEKASLANRIELHLAKEDGIGLGAEVAPPGAGGAKPGAAGGGFADFALAFWMVHEVPDRDRFFREVAGILKPGGRFLLVEPRGHVGKAAFARTVEAATAAGFSPIGQPRTGFSRATLFARRQPA